MVLQSKPSVVVLDAFGTVIVPAVMRSRAYKRLMAERNIKKTTGAERSLRHFFLTTDSPIDELANDLGFGRQVAQVLRELREGVSKLRRYDDADVALKLKAQNCKVMICSNLAHGYGESVRTLVPGADAYVFSYEVGCCKPDPKIYQAVCDAVDVPPASMLFIGDSKRNDVQGQGARHAQRAPEPEAAA